MIFLKQHWFKILILLPFIPVGILIYSLETFTGVSEMLRFLVSFVLVVASLLIFFLGFYFELNKGDLRNKKNRFKVGHLKFGVAEIARVIISLLIVVFLYNVFNFANMSLRIGNVITNITAPSNEQIERSYSLVTMSDFDVNRQGKYGRVGVLTIVDEAVELATEEFLEEQNFILNPVRIAFDSPFGLIDALYEGEVTAVVIGSGFVQNFEDLEAFERIEYETMILETFNVEIEIVERAEIDPGEPLTILLLGLNTAEELLTGQINTFMLLTINLENMSFTITSVPRDSYVPIPCHNYASDKLSHTNIGGTTCAVGAIEHMFDMEIPYYVKLNFTGFMDMVDILGGIEVDVPISFYEQDSRRRMGEEHRIYLEEGIQRLNGEQALALSRHRRSFTTQDFVRVENQQLVFEAMLREMLNEVNSINDLLPLLDVVGRNVETNFTAHELTMLAQYIVEYLANFRNVNIMEEIHFMNMVILGDTPETPIRGVGLVVLPWRSRIYAARELMMINLGLKDPEFSFTFEFDGFARPVRQWGLTEQSYGSESLPPGLQMEVPMQPVENTPFIPQETPVPLNPYPSPTEPDPTPLPTEPNPLPAEPDPTPLPTEPNPLPTEPDLTPLPADPAPDLLP